MDLCRAKGVTSFEDDGAAIKILFGPPPPAKGAKVETDPRLIKRDHYENLLGRKYTDAELDMFP